MQEAATAATGSPSAERSPLDAVWPNPKDCPVIWNRLWCVTAAIRPTFEPAKDNRYLARIDVESYAPLREAPAGTGATSVFVPTLALPRFVRRVFPFVHSRACLVLISGLADAGPAATLAGAGLDACTILDDPRILRWHAENLDFVHSKAGPLPIGVDFHTLAWKPAARPGWGLPASYSQQASELLAAAREANHSDPRCMVHWGYVSPLRAAVTDSVRTSDAFVIDAHPAGTLPRRELWRRMGSHRWVASVAGAGVDCHRTWEALALGCGVVVQDLPLTRALLGDAEVPVLFVPQQCPDSTPAQHTDEDGAAALKAEAASWAAYVTQAALDSAWDSWEARRQDALSGRSLFPSTVPTCDSSAASAREETSMQPWSDMPRVVLSQPWLQVIHRSRADPDESTCLGRTPVRDCDDLA